MEIDGFEWDAGNWPKCGKHGVSKEEIERLFQDKAALIAPDRVHSTPGESRHIAVGRVDGRPMFVAFAMRRGRIRPISARYMHAKEVKNYEAGTKTRD